MACLYRWLILAACLVWAGPVQAAYTLIEWDWSQGSGGTIEGFKIKCGRSTGSYSIITTVTNTAARSYDLYSVTDGKGLWYCTVSAYNGPDETTAATEAIFTLPVPPMILTPNP